VTSSFRAASCCSAAFFSPRPASLHLLNFSTRCRIMLLCAFLRPLHSFTRLVRASCVALAATYCPCLGQSSTQFLSARAFPSLLRVVFAALLLVTCSFRAASLCTAALLSCIFLLAHGCPAPRQRRALLCASCARWLAQWLLDASCIRICPLFSHSQRHRIFNLKPRSQVWRTYRLLAKAVEQLKAMMRREQVN